MSELVYTRHYFFSPENKKIFFFAGLVSVLLSLWSLRVSVINTDAICYLQSAADMKLGLHTATHLCGQAKWPFYSALIYGFSYLTQFSYETAAYVLNSLFTLISVFAFLAIIQYISQQSRVVWLGAVVILLAHQFNAVKQYIIRDHGFWAFYLVSIFCLLNFMRSSQWKYALAWGISLIVATLFRIEGALFLLFIPFIVWFDGRKTMFARFKSFIQLNLPLLLILLTLTVWIVFHPHVELTRLNEVWFQLTRGSTVIASHFIHMKQALAEHVLGSGSANDAGSIFFLMLVSWYAFSVAANVSIIYFILVVYAWMKHLLKTENVVRLVLWSYVVINVLITLAFLVEHLFLSKRYLIALSLVLMIWVPFALDDLFKQWKTKKWLLLSVLFFIMTTSLGGIFDFGYSKKYVYDAGNWLSTNVPSNKTIYSNDLQVMYYSHHFGDSIFQKTKEFSDLKAIADQKWKQYDYLALRVNKHDSTNPAKLISGTNYTRVQTFMNKRGDQVIIYRRNEL